MVHDITGFSWYWIRNHDGNNANLYLRDITLGQKGNVWGIYAIEYRGRDSGLSNHGRVFLHPDRIEIYLRITRNRGECAMDIIIGKSRITEMAIHPEPPV